MPIALLSVSDKTGLLPFAQALVKEHGYKLWAATVDERSATTASSLFTLV